MPNYNRIQPLAFRISPEVTSLPTSLYSLWVPAHWKDLFLRLQTEKGSRAVERTSVPSRDLSRAMRALVPDLVAIEPNAWHKGDRPWLYAAEPVNPQALFLIVRNWAHIAFSHISEARLQGELAPMQASDLQWRQERINLASWSETPNGTAQPESPNAFHLLPEVLAARLSKEGVVLNVGEPPLQFRRAPIVPGSKGAELVSWPPRALADRRGDWLFSVVARLTVQTVPFQPFPVVHCDLSIRRWVNRRLYLPAGKDTSVFLLTQAPWVEGLHHSSSFQVAPMRWRGVPAAERAAGDPPCRVVWESHLTSLVNQLRHPAPGFPDPGELCADPAAALTPFGEQCAAIVFRNGMTPEHRVQPGLPPEDRRALMLALADCLAPELMVLDAPERVLRRKARVAKNPFFPAPTRTGSAADEAVPGIECRAAIVRSIGPRLAVEIRSQESRVFQALETAVREVLGIDSAVQFPFTCPESGLIVQLNVEPLGAIGDGLPLPDTQTSQREALHQAIRDRVRQIAAITEPASVPTATLIEISSAEAFSSSRGEGDPKHAIRKGYAAMGRISQFITSNSVDNLAHRAKSSVLDALRQLGVQPALPQASRLGLPEDLNCVGLWLIKNYRKSSSTRMQRMLPVMVRVDLRTHEVQATAAGMECWLPYSQVLRAIAQEEVPGIENARQARPFIQSLLRQDLLSLGNTLLLCHAQNIRGAWPWLGNGKITPDQLGMGEDSPRPISDWPGLRMIRVRCDDSNETPEWYASDGSSVGFPGGLFKVNDRVYFSTHGKPKQMKTLSTRVSKLSTWANSAGKSRPSTPQVHTWNSRILEMTVASLQPEDEGKAADWAYLTHLLRDAAGHFDERTMLPLPLHLAKLMDEYVLPITPEDAGN